MNKVILIGRLARDPEMRTTPSGVATTSFTIAVQRNYANAQGDREADFISCVAWRKQAENIAKYCSKGSMALLYSCGMSTIVKLLPSSLKPTLYIPSCVTRNAFSA